MELARFCRWFGVDSWLVCFSFELAVLVILVVVVAVVMVLVPGLLEAGLLMTSLSGCAGGPLRRSSGYLCRRV